MTTKIRMKVGTVEVEYEGPEAFLKKELPGLVTHMSSVASQVPESGDSHHAEDGIRNGASNGKVGTLAAFLKDAQVGKSATKRFLATAEWLHRKGNGELQTRDVTKALRENHQPRLGNASQCLINNVNGGYCEKHGRNFYVTDDGRASLKK